jgi:hypothetical protein
VETRDGTPYVQCARKSVVTRAAKAAAEAERVPVGAGSRR